MLKTYIIHITLYISNIVQLLQNYDSYFSSRLIYSLQLTWIVEIITLPYTNHNISNYYYKIVLAVLSLTLSTEGNQILNWLSGTSVVSKLKVSLVLIRYI